MNTRKQTLFAVLAILAAPLAASAATSDRTYAPLSSLQSVEKSETSHAGDRSGVIARYPLLSYGPTAPRTVENGGDVASTSDDSGKATSYALSSYAGHDRG